MSQILQKGKWAVARIVFLILALVGMTSGGVAMYLLGPLSSWYLFNDIRFLRYHRLFFPIVAAYWKLVFELFHSPAYRGMFTIAWTAPPVAGPDLSRVRVRGSWSGTDDACNGCVECCTRRACPMLDVKRNRCRSYGSFFWRYFNCGRYPEDEAQIMFYECPKWEVRGD